MNPVMHSLYSLQKAHLNIHICDITDIDQDCKPMNLGHKPLVWWELPLATTWVQIGDCYLIGRKFAQCDHIWSWDTPLAREYNYQTREYCDFILIKYLHYSNGLLVHQIQLNNSQ